MKIKSIGSNQTELAIGATTTVLFSYSTPVAARVDGAAYRTEVAHSKTTQRHISQWLNGQKAEIRPQEWFNDLTA